MVAEPGPLGVVPAGCGGPGGGRFLVPSAYYPKLVADLTAFASAPVTRGDDGWL